MSRTREEQMEAAGDDHAGSWASMFRSILPVATSVVPAAASLAFPVATKLVTAATSSTSSKPSKKEPGESKKTDEEKMELSGTDRVPRPVLVIVRRRVSNMGAAGQSVLKMQRALAGIGLPVKATGKIDRATVEGVNNVLRGWDDAPASIKKGGELTSVGIARNLPAVTKAIAKAIGGAKNFGDASHSDE